MGYLFWINVEDIINSRKENLRDFDTCQNAGKIKNMQII